jgi:hypothetical protein
MTSRLLTILCAIWGVVLALGFAWMDEFEATPGLRGMAADVWPRDSRLELSSDRMTLVMVLHPWCVCSRASVGELERFVRGHRSQLAIHFVMTIPEPSEKSSTEAEPEGGTLRELTSRIPGATCHYDLHGAERRRFDARTSGETFVYSPDGTLLFHGGITSRRGQMGHSAGLDALQQIVSAKPARMITTPVFGCSLIDWQDVPVSAVERGVP